MIVRIEFNCTEQQFTYIVRHFLEQGIPVLDNSITRTIIVTLFETPKRDILKLKTITATLADSATATTTLVSLVVTKLRIPA